MKKIRTTLVLMLLMVFISSCSYLTPSQQTVSYPPPPVLPSAVEMYKDGQKGLWMNEHDVANLLIWVNTISTSQQPEYF